ncbi:hypothetical protein DACRYDRAFT_117317 [Dacryopinax primogenitus]|uniref:Protein kinase domain-containing protein n=1 Tax=Dacryopinax primogenitus (strain DJM 731) TaxID=1858805 RepID=M5G922_DACPD|nr:uncharacterized protein DACRYDRAFT_117317 [Dacryopinax primogenitus]EJU00283.1 hypothetical protein DACRYDRAFT_117317 [Dacryopinax primogenitus]
MSYSDVDDMGGHQDEYSDDDDGNLAIYRRREALINLLRCGHHIRTVPSNDKHGVSFDFDLTRPLQVGNRRWAQVWEAVTYDFDGDYQTLVVKLFIDSLFPTPESQGFDMAGTWTAARLRDSESWAYNALSDLQGGLLPVSGGFYEFDLGLGERACGHVMELIDGRRLERDWETFGQPQWHTLEASREREARMVKFMVMVSELHKRGVVHNDLKPSNVIVPDHDPGSFVFLDFAIAKSIQHPNFKNNREEDLLCMKTMHLEQPSV